MRRASAAAAAFLLLACMPALARGWGHSEQAADEVQAVEGPPALIDSDRGSVTASLLGSRKQEVLEAGDEEGAPPPLSGKPKETIAQILDEALKEEFQKEEDHKEGVGQHFNETAASDEGTKETVIIISSKKEKEKEKEKELARKGNATDEGAEGQHTHTTTASTAAAADADAQPGDARHIAGGSGGLGDGAALMGASSAADAVDAATHKAEAEKGVEEKRKANLEEKLNEAAEADVDRIIDSQDNEYVLSKPNDDTMGMNLDPQFVKDLTVLIAASAAAGLAMGAVGQPAINGYFIAGSLVGPGGLKLIKEIVQVQSVAQLGVQLLLFTLGLEFSLTKLRAVRNVALLGGLLQTALFAIVAGIGARLIGTSAAQGGFVGAMVAMSSTSIVVKVLSENRTSNTPAGQITIGTLILQDCLVGLLFALMPVLAAAGGSEGFDITLLLTVMGRVVAKLAVLAVGALVVARTVLPPAMRALQRRFGPDSFQLAAVAFCLLCALATARQGISAELGAFVAGVMLSATEQQESVLHNIEPVTQFFLTLFISSTGLVLSPVFLMDHLPILAAGAVAVIISKTVLIAIVVKAFRYPADTALAVGLNLSQIGEFVFVLLSMANQQSLLPESVYMLMMGVTALTLLATPFVLQLSNRFMPKARGYPNGSNAGDLELAGLISNGNGSAGTQKRRVSILLETADKAVTPESSPSGNRGVPTPLSGQLLGVPSDLELAEGGGLAHSMQPMLTRLEHRGPAHAQRMLASGGSSAHLDERTSGSGSFSSPAFTAR